MDCSSAGQNDVDLWVLVWSKVGVDEGFDTRVVLTKAYTTHEEKTTLDDRQVAWVGRRGRACC